MAPLTVRIADGLRKRNGYKFPQLGPLAYRAFFGILPRHIDVELLPGIRAQLNTADGTQRSTYWQGSRFERATPLILREWAAHSGAIFFDIGSNYGWFSFYLTSELARLPIYSFEPNPPTFERLKAIVEGNNLRNVHPNNLALGDRVMTSRLRIGVEDSGHSSLGPHPELSADNAIEISVQPFDTWRREAGLELPSSPSWVAKIDVEGYECHVLAGMREALDARAFRGLAVEVNPFALEFNGASETGLISLLNRMGYVERPPELPNERSTMNKFFVPRA